MCVPKYANLLQLSRHPKDVRPERQASRTESRAPGTQIPQTLLEYSSRPQFFNFLLFAFLLSQDPRLPFLQSKSREEPGRKDGKKLCKKTKQITEERHLEKN